MIWYDAQWTEANGKSNSSVRYLQLVEAVNAIIRGSAHQLLTGDSYGVAGLIVSQLAYYHGLRPPEEK